MNGRVNICFSNLSVKICSESRLDGATKNSSQFWGIRRVSKGLTTNVAAKF